MFLLKLFGKIAAIPIMLILTLAKWVGVFLIGFSSVVFNLLAGLLLLAATLSYLMGLVAGPDALRMILAGFVIFMVPVAGEAIVTAISAANAGLHDFIMS